MPMCTSPGPEDIRRWNAGIVLYEEGIRGQSDFASRSDIECE
jgi:predicted Fe-Mo cluster-binding NifX family protein